MNSQWKNYLQVGLRVAIGLVFVVSAIFKLISLDEFEIYIHSFGLFDFVLCTLLARLLIAFEFLLGVGLAAKLFYKKVWGLSMLTMLGFTLFLVYVAVFRSDDNCHCFGTIVEVKPTISIIKNVVMILVLCCVKNQQDSKFRYRKIFIGSSIALSVIVPFVVFPMDVLYNKIVSPERDFNQSAFEQLLQDSVMQPVAHVQEPQLFAFYISGCRYCRLSMKKLTSIVEQNHLDENRIVVVIIGLDKNIEEFKRDTGAEEYSFYGFHNEQVSNIMKITFGNFPTFALIEGKDVAKVMNYRGLEEYEIVKFLRDE